MKHRCLFVGGAFDGEWRDVEMIWGINGYRMPPDISLAELEPLDAPVADIESPDKPMEVVARRKEDFYVRDEIHVGRSKTYTFYVEYRAFNKARPGSALVEHLMKGYGGCDVS